MIKLSDNIKDSKKFFSHFNTKGKEKKNINIIKNNDNTFYDNDSIVNEFNNFFHSIFNKTDTNLMREINRNDNYDSLSITKNAYETNETNNECNSICNIEIREENIHKFIQNLNSNKSAGHDISVKVLKEGGISI